MLMTHTDTETRSRKSTRAWTEPLFVTGAGLTLLTILTYEGSNWVPGSGAGLRLAGISLSVIAGVVLAIWALRRRDPGTKRNGAFALTCGILGLLAAGAAYLLEQAVQHAMNLAVFGPLATLTMTLVAFGLISLIGGVIKRINA